MGLQDKLSLSFKLNKSSSSLAPLKRITIASIALSAASIVLVSLLQKNLPPQVPLFYGLAEGEEQLATPILLIVPASISLIIIFVNSLISHLWKNEFLQEALTFAALAVSVLSAIATFKVILLVGSF